MNNGDALEILNDVVLERLAALGVNVYGLPESYTAEQRDLITDTANKSGWDITGYALRMNDIINRCETKLSNSLVTIKDLTEAVEDW